MPRWTLVLLMTVVAAATLAAPPTFSSFSDALQVWRQTEGDAAYQAYAAEFRRFVRENHLDETGPCASGRGSVTLLLVVEQGAVRQVIPDSEDETARCYMYRWHDLQVKAPPYEPFVLRYVAWH